MIDAGLDVRAFFTFRHGGTSDAPYDSLNLAVHVGDEPAHVDLNRALVEHEAGVPVAFINAEHGVRVHRVVDPRAEVPAADILVTTEPGVGLAALVADCVPLLMHDALTGAVLAAHVGREGLYKGAVDAAVAALIDLRPPRARGGITASIGPAVCGRCYEVPIGMRARVTQRHPSALATTRWGTPALDIPRAVETRLAELGVDQVLRHRYCTYEETMLFSVRRDGMTGRCAGVIASDGVSLPRASARRP